MSMLPAVTGDCVNVLKERVVESPDFKKHLRLCLLGSQVKEDGAAAMSRTDREGFDGSTMASH
jgi:hypothetical protein